MSGEVREEVSRDIADPSRMAGLAALLDHRAPPWAEGMLPPLGHWLCFHPQALQSQIGADGHPRRGGDGLIPDLGLPRRMWAGSRIDFLRPIPLGTPIERRTRVASIEHKTGRSGAMAFVTLEHRVFPDGAEPALIEQQDIVYREAATPGAAFIRPAVEVGAPDAEVREITADPVMLFRYSALTFNGHRIHYDRDYTVQTEGYPGLVVHGPLIATLLLDHLLRLRPGAEVTQFAFRAMSPLFDGEPIALGLTGTSDTAKLRAIGPAGTAMTATARYR